MRQLLLAVDIGSTSIKAILFDIDGGSVMTAKRPTPYATDAEGVFYNASMIWESTAEAIAEAVSQCSDEIAAVAVTGFGNDGVPLDCNGQALYPFISWKCSRTVPQFERFMNTFGKKCMFMATGMQARPIDAIYKMMWLYENHPELTDRMKNWLMVEDYINYMLCGEMVSDHTVAFTSGLFDPAAEQWSCEVGAAAGIPIDIMPAVKPSGTVIGRVGAEAAEATAIKKGTPVILGGWDIICSSLAVGAFQDGVVMDVMGTWETIMAASGEYTRNQEIYSLGLNACHHVAQGKYAYPVYFVSSAMVEWFLNVYLGRQNEINENKLYQIFISEAIKAPPGCKGAMFLPNLFGSAAPVVDGRSRGAFVGLTDQTGRPEMARALLEGLSFLCKQVLDGYERFMGSSQSEIIICGGGGRNKAWCHIKSDITGKALKLSAIEETTALGAALKAGVGMGLYKDDNEAVEAVRTNLIRIEGQKKTMALYNRLYPIFTRLYSDLKSVNSALYEWELYGGGQGE